MIKYIVRSWCLIFLGLIVIPAVLHAREPIFAYKLEAEKKVYEPHEPIRIALTITHNTRPEISLVYPRGNVGRSHGLTVHNSKKRKPGVYLGLEGPGGSDVECRRRPHFSFDMPEDIKKKDTKKVYLDLGKNYVLRKPGVYSIDARVDGQDAGSFKFRVEPVDEQYRNQVLNQMQQGPLKSRREAMRKARYTGNRKLIEGILGVAADRGQKLKVRLAALEELVKNRKEYVGKADREMEKPYVMKALSRIAREGKPPEVRGRALEVLGDLIPIDRRAEFKDVFMEGLKSPQKAVRMGAARGLEQYGSGGRDWEFTASQKKFLKEQIADDRTPEPVRYHLLDTVPLGEEDMQWAKKIVAEDESGRVRKRAINRSTSEVFDDDTEEKQNQWLVEIARKDPDGRVRGMALGSLVLDDGAEGYRRTEKLLFELSERLKKGEINISHKQELKDKIEANLKWIEERLNLSPDRRKDDTEFLIKHAGPGNPSDRGRLVALRCLLEKDDLELSPKIVAAAKQLMNSEVRMFRDDERTTVGAEAEKVLERIKNPPTGRDQQKDKGEKKNIPVKHPRIVIDIRQKHVILVDGEKMTLTELTEMLKDKGQNAIVEVEVERGVSIERTQKVLDMVTEADCHRIKFDGHPGPEK